MQTQEIAHLAVEAAADKKAADIVILDIHELTTIADYFVICTGDSSRQLEAIVDHILENTKKNGIRSLHVDGSPDSGWVIVDLSSVIIHAFSPEMRKFYQLDQLWSAAHIVMRMP